MHWAQGTLQYQFKQWFILVLLLSQTFSAQSSILNLNPITASSSIDSTDCEQILKRMNNDSVIKQRKHIGTDALLEWHHCALTFKNTSQANLAYELLRSKTQLPITAWIKLIEHYQVFDHKIMELVVIEEARQIYPRSELFIEKEVTYHIQNKTTHDYERKIEARIRAGDPQFYYLLAKLNTAQGKKASETYQRVNYFEQAKVNLETLHTFNPYQKASKALLIEVHDSLSSFLLQRIAASKSPREIDSLAEKEWTHFYKELELEAEQKKGSDYVQLDELFARVHGWEGDVVSFEVVNWGKRRVHLTSKSTPHFTLSGGKSIPANGKRQYKLKVLPSASQSEFELTPTLFFSNYEGSISLVISGYVSDKTKLETPKFNSSLKEKNKPCKLKVLDQKTHQVIYHAQTTLSANGDSIWLNSGIANFEIPLATYNLNITALGYKSTHQKVDLQEERNELIIYLEAEREDELGEVTIESKKTEEDQLKSTGSVLENFKNSAIPSQHIIIMVDVSQSMKRAGYIQEITSGLKQLVQNLRPQDTVSILTFSTSRTVIADHVGASLIDSLTHALAKVKPQGGTNAKVALKSGFEIANRYNQPQTKSVLILLTDGRLISPGTPSNWYEPYLLKNYRPLNFKLNIILYSNKPGDFTSLARLSRVTGGVTKPGIDDNLGELIVRYCLQP